MSKKHYTELFEMPLLNWEKCMEGDLKFIRIKRSDKAVDSDDVEAFYSLYNKYIKKYGLSQDLKDYLEAQKHFIELAILYSESEKPDKSLINQITVAKARLDELNPNNHEGMTIGQVVIMLNKWMGQWINKSQISVEEFKSLIKEYERENKKE